MEAALIGVDAQQRIANPNLPTLVNDRLSVSSLVLLTGRLGYALDNKLFYVKGGYADGHTEFRGTCDLCGNIALNVASRHSGWTLGGGLEYALAKNWTLGVDYSYVKLNGATDAGIYSVNGLPVTFLGTPTYNSSVNLNMVGVRLNYLLGH